MHQALENVGHFIQSVRIASRALLLSVAWAGGLASVVTPAAAEKRIALAIGNDLYPNLPADRQLRRRPTIPSRCGDAGVARLRGDSSARDLGRQAIIDNLADLTARLQPAIPVFFMPAMASPSAASTIGPATCRRSARARRPACGAPRSPNPTLLPSSRPRACGWRCSCSTPAATIRSRVPAARSVGTRGACRRQACARRLHALFSRHRPDRARPAGAERRQSELGLHARVRRAVGAARICTSANSRSRCAKGG